MNVLEKNVSISFTPCGFIGRISVSDGEVSV